MSTSSKATSPRLLVINQVVGPLMRQLLADLTSSGIACTAYTGWVDSPAPESEPYKILWGAELIKAPAAKRLISWARFTFGAVAAMLRHRTPVLITTNPPLVSLLAPWLKRLCGIPYVLLIYDVYPDVLERMGVLRTNGWIARAWKRLNAEAMTHAAAVVTLGKYMAATLRAHLRPGSPVEIAIIPNWADTDAIHPRPRESNPFVAEHGLAGKLVVTYSGSFGATHDTESIIEAARLLRDRPDVHFMLIGDGTRRKRVEELVRHANLPNLTLLDLQPAEVLPLSLAASDCCIVCLDEGYEGVSVPSKTYSALAAGAAILAVTNEPTELADLVREHNCGIAAPPRNPRRLADAVTGYVADPALLVIHRRNARDAAIREHSRRGSMTVMGRLISVAAGWEEGEPPTPTKSDPSMRRLNE